jgi:cytochrome c
MTSFSLRLYRCLPRFQKIEFVKSARGRTAIVKRQLKVNAMVSTSRTVLVCLATATLAAVFAPSAWAVDVEAAKALARQNNCLKCHSIDKDKDGPAYNKVAEKYRGKANAEARLIDHITSGEKAKFPDGHEEEHKIVKTSPPKDMAQIKNLVEWILSQ